ncbi:MAG: HNH endonuclease, partial [Gordonia sp. (in: high G+C Gram-positive bacteria)]
MTSMNADWRGVAVMNDDAASPALDVAVLLEGLSAAQLLAVQEAAEKRLQSAALVAQSEDGLLDLLASRERTLCARQVFDAALYVELSDRGAYRKGGFISMPALYSGGLRLGSGEARRRRVLATELGRFTTMTGERREPSLPATEAAVADGEIG